MQVATNCVALYHRAVLSHLLSFGRHTSRMSADTMKLELIQWLSQLEDKGLLASLLHFKKANEAGDWYDTLPVEQKVAIAEGEADTEAGA